MNQMFLRSMTASRPLVAPFMLLLAFCLPACSSDPELELLPPDAVILAFGDSLTAGYGVSKPQAYPAQLAEITGMNVINAGISGEESGEGLKRLPAVLAEHQPQLVLLCLGGNDMLRKRNLAVTAENLKAMIGLIRAAGAQVVMMSVPKPGIVLSNAPFYAEVAEATGVPLQDDILKSVLQFPDSKSDPIHPNAKGYREIAEALAEELRDLGAL